MRINYSAVARSDLPKMKLIAIFTLLFSTCERRVVVHGLDGRNDADLVADVSDVIQLSNHFIQRKRKKTL